MKNHFVNAAFMIRITTINTKYDSATIIWNKSSPLIFRMGMSINAYFVRILKHAWNNLPGCEISANCDYKSKHCEATV